MVNYNELLDIHIPNCENKTKTGILNRKVFHEKDLEILFNKKAIIVNEKMIKIFEEIKYIFKKSMLIIILEKEQIIKILYSPKNNIKELINLTILFYYTKEFKSHIEICKKKIHKSFKL